MEKRKKISVCCSAYNEESNIREFYGRVLEQLKKFPQYDYEFIIADNCSTDRTREILREIAAEDKNFKCIFNANNFGPDRSAYNSFLQCTGDAMISMCTDLQDPPEYIEEFIRKWEEGYNLVCGVKKNYSGNIVMILIRKCYYRLLRTVSDVDLIPDFHGFGLYDRKMLVAMKLYHDAEPYARGIVSEIGMKRCEIPYRQAERKGGKSSYNLFRYYDFAMVGLVNYSKLPLRLAIFSGFFIAMVSLLVALGYFIYKLVNWDSFQLGLAPLVIGLFFFSAVQLIFIGILGEYIGAIWTQVKNKPLVIEEERINFDNESGK
ncbi:MAG: glycosyltransferase [Lentisphaeria bacterium]|nr:glycosyltransferase [Lentisphaeria bacterium]